MSTQKHRSKIWYAQIARASTRFSATGRRESCRRAPPSAGAWQLHRKLYLLGAPNWSPRLYDHIFGYMPASRKSEIPTKLMEEWSLPTGATLGSSVRAKGILLEVRAQLQPATRKLVNLEHNMLNLRVAEDAADADIDAIAATVSKTLARIEDLPVIPREIEDILSISATERHRWLKDGRLKSAGTRTVKLRGRARKITFHVFDPRHVEDVLDRDLVTVWREEDAVVAAENRRRAAGKAALSRARKAAAIGVKVEAADETPEGWEEFESEGFLR
jgi:hypothetical protein